MQTFALRKARVLPSRICSARAFTPSCSSSSRRILSTEIDQRFAWHHFTGESVIQRPQHSLLNLAQGHVVSSLLPGQFFHRKLSWKIDRDGSRFSRFLSHYLFAKTRNKIVEREPQPE